MAPAPDVGADSPLQAPVLAPTPGTGSPSGTQEISPASDKSNAPSSASAPVPVPTGTSNVNHSDINADGDGARSTVRGGGAMNAGKKAGIALAVLVLVCAVGLGGLVYKKRRDNIRRCQYGYAVRREIL